MAGSRDWVELGRIGSPYGVKGWVHVESFTNPPDGLLDYPRWRLRVGTRPPVTLNVEEARIHGQGIVALLEGVEDRDGAVAIRGALIEIARSELPPTGEREYYEADLIGLAVSNLEGVALGVLTHFIAAGANSLMVVVEGEQERLIPAVPQYLSKVDLASGRITVDWPAELE